MFVLRRSGRNLGAGADRLVLEPLDGDGVAVIFAWSETVAPGADAFEILFDVGGRWRAAPRFAVFADWQVAPDGDAVGFRQSRFDLFTLRVGTIEVFCVDYLLRRVDDANRLTVLGLYGTREGLDLARGHPQIVAWAKAHPPARWGASDVSGMKLFRIVHADGWPVAEP